MYTLAIILRSLWKAGSELGVEVIFISDDSEFSKHPYIEQMLYLWESLCLVLLCSPFAAALPSPAL